MSHLLFICIMIGMAMLLYHTFLVRTTIVECRAPRLPALTLIHITDLHGRTHFLNGSLHRLINKWQPDLVCVTGDLVQFRRQLKRVMGEIGRIEAREGIFFVPGNYEREEKRVIGKLRYTDQEYERMKRVWEGSMRVLENQGIAVPFENKILYLYGFDNSVYGNEKYVPQHREEEPDYTVFLAHSPNIISYIEERGLRADLLLTGHTHGGQVRLFGKTWGAYKHFHVGVKPDNRVGLFAISRGLGTTKLPVRFGCFPEITVYRFNSDRISL
ncbi:metallophosphoesterase [Brevibacillus panacihumi]|uniref:Calcineurin-like phosphoesterase domain-containing protein n=1 Tax=Brevibacillus panacihumi TaxID=497735 RepID=A0A3M8CRH2_9BACL|nr:metallophosphoesterase [Brevibacillus panacihumi]RNB78021.1 hypothetical protein EDM58_13530 [Brevibacillus panacihumi]